MNDWRPDWNRRLADPPFKNQRFRTDMMEAVEERLQAVEKKRFRRDWIRTIGAFVPVVLLLFGVGIWFGYQAAPNANPVSPGPVVPKGGTFQSGFVSGSGGDFDWWNLADREVSQESDRTIVTLATALLKREIGIWGGPTPDIWEHPEVKWPLERYDVSSPWVYEIYVNEITTDAEQTVYKLRLLLRDSIPMVYEETIDVTIRNDTHRISRIQLISTDETGTPRDDFEAGDDQGTTVTLKEDAALDLKITGTLFKEAGTIRSINVQYGDSERTFADWSSVSNESYYPETAILSPGSSGKEKDILAIVLTTGYGTGMRESALKLLTDDLIEVMAADPVLASQSRLSYHMTAEDGKRIFQLTLSGVTRSFEYKEEDAGFWLDQPALGSIVRYSVEENTLYASVPIQVSPGNFPAEVRLRYEYDGNTYLVAEATLEEI